MVSNSLSYHCQEDQQKGCPCHLRASSWKGFEELETLNPIHDSLPFFTSCFRESTVVAAAEG